MRGTDETSGSLFSYVDLEARIPARHPLRKIRQVVNDALASLDAEFDALYTDFGRPSIAPERLIRASLIQILFSIRSERQLMEQMQYNLLFRWFVGLGIGLVAVWCRSFDSAMCSKGDEPWAQSGRMNFARTRCGLNRPGFTGGQNSRRVARYGTDIKEEDLEAVFTRVPRARGAFGDGTPRWISERSCGADGDRGCPL